MRRGIRLREIAHARAGDKGNTSNVSIWAFEERHYAAIRSQITAERVRSAFPNLVKGRVEVFALPHLLGLNLVLHDALEGGVNGSLNLDGHGKSWSYLLLGLEIDLDA